MRRGLRRCLLSVEVIHAQELRGGWPPNSHHAGGSLVESAKAMINRRGFLQYTNDPVPGKPMLGTLCRVRGCTVVLEHMMSAVTARL